MSLKARRILWLDSGAGLLAGLFVLLLHSWLADLYGFVNELVLFLGAANLVYSSYSGSLVLRVAKVGNVPRIAVDVLVAANFAWVIVCAVIVTATWSSARALGMAHVVFEGLFVAALAVAELRLVRPEAH